MAKKKDSRGFSEEEQRRAHYKQGGQCIGCWAMFPFEEMEVDDSNEKTSSYDSPQMVCHECNKNKDGDWKAQTMRLDAYMGLKPTDTEDE